jgi:hypothetical protein
VTGGATSGAGSSALGRARRRIQQLKNRMVVSLVSDRAIEQWSDRTRLFFVLAIGRSGTMFLASLLDRAEAATVEHEPVREDFQAYQEAFHSEVAARAYLERFRRREMYLRLREGAPGTYGEVNSYLRRHAGALRTVFPSATLIHLVRDPRAVVRSMMARDTLGETDRNTRLIHPAPSDPWYESWPRMSRFERICWYWQHENRYLRASLRAVVRFEDLVSSWELFRDGLLGPIGLELPREVWASAVAQPVNSTPAHRRARAEWTPAEQESFVRLCGEEMAHYGYDPAG